MQNRSPAHQGAGHGGAGRISGKRLKLLTQGEPERRRKLQLGTPTALGLRLQCPITIQRGNDWSFGRPVIISHLDNCTGFPTGPHVSRRMHLARGHHSDLSKAPPSSCHSPWTNCCCLPFALGPGPGTLAQSSRPCVALLPLLVSFLPTPSSCLTMAPKGRCCGA